MSHLKVTDNASFVLFTPYFNLTPTFSSQQSAVTEAVVFSYRTIRQHLPPFGATAKFGLLSLTDLTFSCDCPPNVQKDDINKTSSSQLCSEGTKAEQKSSASCPSCRKTTKGSLQKCQLDTSKP